MKIPKLLVPSVLKSLLVSSLVSIVGATVSGQSKRVVTQRDSTITVGEYTEIPEATEPCTPEECQWWKQIREAGNTLQRKGDEKSKTRFALLFAEGLQKAYHVPLKDRPPHLLVRSQPVLSEMTVARLRMKQTNGSADLSVEFRADGSIGDVQLIKSLDKEFDMSAVQAVRQALFVPAIKDGSFITFREKVGFGFFTRPKG